MPIRRIAEAVLIPALLLIASTAWAQSFSAAQNFASGSTLTGLRAADFNGDGRLDLVTTGDAAANNVHVLLGNGNGTFGAASLLTAGNRAYGLAVGDFNGDGRMDIAAGSSSDNNVTIFLGNGNGTFAAGVAYAAGTFVRALAAGDVNGDSFIDLVACNSTTSNVSVLIGNGDGTFQAPATSAAGGTDPIGLALADINNDTLLDLVIANYTSSNISVRLGTGGGTFGAVTNYATGTNATNVAIGLINADPIPDLAVTNANSNNVSVLMGSGNGTFQAAVNYTAGTNPRSVVIGDFDGDGDRDLAAANYDSGNLSLLYNNGAGVFAPVVNMATAAGAESVIFATLNADNAPDIAVANQNGSNVSVLLNNPGPSSLNVSTAAAPQVDVAQPVTVTVLDAFGSTVTGYTGMIAFTSSDAMAVLPANYTYTVGDMGTKAFTAVFRSDGAQSITATSTSAPIVTGTANVTATNTAPQVIFVTASPALARVGQTVAFTALATDAEAQALTYAWSFGVGPGASGQSVTRSFNTAGTYTVTVTVSDTLNASAAGTVTVIIQNPVIASMLVAPSPSGVGGMVTYTGMVADILNVGFVYDWNFGDGATARGSTVTHVYTAAGVYLVKLTVTAPGGGTSEASRSHTVSGLANGGIDSDGDGFSDGIEALAGSDPLSGASTPTGKPFAEPDTLKIEKLSANFKFKKAAGDSLHIRGHLAGAAETELDDSAFVIDIGGIGRRHVLNDKGQLATKSATDRVKLKKQKDGSLMFDLNIGKSELAASLADEGVENSDADKEIDIAVMIIFGGKAYFSTVTARYTAKQGKNGRIK